MQLRACLGILLLATGACTHIPEVIRLDVGGNTVEVKKKPERVEEPEDADPEPEAPTQDDDRK